MKWIWPALKAIWFSVQLTLVGFFLLAVYRGSLSQVVGQNGSGGSAVIEYKDFVAILLSAIGVMVTILALVIAILAFWGYAEIKNQILASSKSIATETARNTARDEASAVAVKTIRERKKQDDISSELDYGAAAGKNDNDTHR